MLSDGVMIIIIFAAIILIPTIVVLLYWVSARTAEREKRIIIWG